MKQAKSQSPQMWGEHATGGCLADECGLVLLGGFEVFDDGLGTRANVQLLIDCFEVVADGFVAEGKVVGDLFRCHAFGEALEDLTLALGEAGDLFLLGFDRFFEGLNEQAGDVLAEGGAAFACLTNTGGDV